MLVTLSGWLIYCLFKSLHGMVRVHLCALHDLRNQACYMIIYRTRDNHPESVLKWNKCPVDCFDNYRLILYRIVQRIRQQIEDQRSLDIWTKRAPIHFKSAAPDPKRRILNSDAKSALRLVYLSPPSRRSN